jgi:hypothetical protein
MPAVRPSRSVPPSFFSYFLTPPYILALSSFFALILHSTPPMTTMDGIKKLEAPRKIVTDLWGPE